MNASDRIPDLCSIIMPCYNRATFLREALQAIQSQTWTNWELVLVDDGSKDNTRETLDALVKELGITQPVSYHYQDNAGPYAARNTGLSKARGEFVAFYDSDDLWLPHHLKDGVEALRKHADLDWVYADSTKVDLATGKTVVERGFHEYNRRHPFLSLNAKRDGKLAIFDDPGVVACQISSNLCCLLQTSVIRAKVFEGHPFVDGYRNEGEDELYPIRAMKRGFKLGYFDDVHLIYRFHQNNSSTAAIGASVEKKLRVTAAAARGYEELGQQVKLTAVERRALNERLANEYFWKRGYAICWAAGLPKQAMREYIKGLKYTPTDVRMVRTFAGCVLRSLIGRWPSPETATQAST
jgi:glycosyltransferase involved in cell wall biosynthesis